jgi:hypothetical protein
MSGLDGLCLIGLDSSDLRRGSVGSRGRALRRSVPVVVMFSVFRSPVSRGRVSRRVFRSLSLLRLRINRSITHSHSHSALRDTARVAAATPYNVDRLQGEVEKKNEYLFRVIPMYMYMYLRIRYVKHSSISRALSWALLRTCGIFQRLPQLSQEISRRSTEFCQ